MDFFTPKHLAFQTSEAKKLAGVFCCAYGCKKPANAKKRGLCHTHYSIHRRIVDPVYNRYVNFKGNAAKRPWKGGVGIPFTITLEEFRKFCAETGYIICKGKRGFNCTIDRRINSEGYHIWNIQLKSIGANIAKYHGVDKHFTELPPTHEDYTPF